MENSITSPANTKLVTIVPYFDGFYGDTFSEQKIDDVAGVSDYFYDVWEEDNPQRAAETKTNGFATWIIPAETDDEYRERRDSYFEALYDSTDWEQLQEEYCAAFVRAFSEDNNIKLEFESMSSPQYYNFTTDRVFAYITLEEMQRVYDSCNKTKLAELIKENFTSYSGFSSFYPGNIDEWDFSDLAELDHNELGIILQCATAEHIEEEDKNYPYIASLMEYYNR